LLLKVTAIVAELAPQLPLPSDPSFLNLLHKR